jgi:hypothetical protein
MAGLIVFPLLLAWALLPASAKPGAGRPLGQDRAAAAAPASQLAGRPDPTKARNPRRPVRPTTTTRAATTTTRAATTTKPSTPETTQRPAPAFPQGIWTSGSPSSLTGADLAQIKSLGYDFVQANPDISVLDRVDAAGLKAMIWLGNYRDEDDSPPNCVWNTSDATLRTQINLVKNHPAVLGYTIADEPHVGACTKSPQQVLDRHNLIRSLDPNTDHPTLITENRYADYAALANKTDIMGLVGYPCSIAKGCRQSVVQDRIDAANAAGVQHYWSMPQIDGDSYYRVPTPTELQQIYAWWRVPSSRQEGALTFLWHGCDSCDGLANHRELHATVAAEGTNF